MLQIESILIVFTQLSLKVNIFKRNYKIPSYGLHVLAYKNVNIFSWSTKITLFVTVNFNQQAGNVLLDSCTLSSYQLVYAVTVLLNSENIWAGIVIVRSHELYPYVCLWTLLVRQYSESLGFYDHVIQVAVGLRQSNDWRMLSIV